MEEHGGRIELGDAADKIPGQRGAWMRLRFAAESASSSPEAQPARQAPSPQLATSV
jgi:two-component system nitrogen regulation sensor histidine kinase NtrY